MKMPMVDKKVWVRAPGANGFIISAIIRRLSKERVNGYAFTCDEVDLLYV